MEKFVYRKDLLNPSVVRELTKRSDNPAIVHLVIHLALIAICGWFVSLAYPGWWLVLAWPAYGIAIAFLFAPLHECIHRTAFRNRLANEIVATLAGFVLLLPANYFRFFHFAHHRYTNDPVRDPELLTPKPVNIGQYLWAMWGIGSYWWPQIRSIGRHCLGKVDEDFIPEAKHSLVVVEARLHFAGYAAIIMGSLLLESPWALIYWIVPVMLGMIALRMFLLAEHTGCELSDNMLRNTRTTLTNPAINLLAWNMPYHCEHHVFPAVPFHQLPKLHDHLKPHLAVVSNGYHRVHREFLDSI